jgi:hypothetical protein
MTHTQLILWCLKKDQSLNDEKERDEWIKALKSFYPEIYKEMWGNVDLNYISCTILLSEKLKTFWTKIRNAQSFTWFYGSEDLSNITNYDGKYGYPEEE